MLSKICICMYSSFSLRFLKSWNPFDIIDAVYCRFVDISKTFYIQVLQCNSTNLDFYHIEDLHSYNLYMFFALNSFWTHLMLETCKWKWSHGYHGWEFTRCLFVVSMTINATTRNIKSSFYVKLWIDWACLFPHNSNQFNCYLYVHVYSIHVSTTWMMKLHHMKLHIFIGHSYC
jgi:hypothetical protein